MKKYFCLILILILIVSCTKPLYKYYNYDEATYCDLTAYEVKDVKKASQSYARIVGADKKHKKKTTKKPKKNTIPPGACLDYATMLLQTNDTVKARAYFDQEILLYPESAPYVRQLEKKLGL